MFGFFFVLVKNKKMNVLMWKIQQWYCVYKVWYIYFPTKTIKQWPHLSSEWHTHRSLFWRFLSLNWTENPYLPLFFHAHGKKQKTDCDGLRSKQSRVQTLGFKAKAVSYRCWKKTVRKTGLLFFWFRSFFLHSFSNITKPWLQTGSFFQRLRIIW